MTAPARRAGPADRAEAVEHFRVHGSRQAARDTGWPEASIRRWASKAGVRTEVVGLTVAASEAARVRADRIREDLRLKILATAVDVLGRINAPHLERKVLADGRIVDVHHELPTATANREYAVAFGILLDKYRLEMGEATDRTRRDLNVTNVPEDQIERDIERLARVLPVRKPV